LCALENYSISEHLFFIVSHKLQDLRPYQHRKTKLTPKIHCIGTNQNYWRRHSD